MGGFSRGALCEHAVGDVLRRDGGWDAAGRRGVDALEALVGVGPSGEEEGVGRGIAQRVFESLRAAFLSARLTGYRVVRAELCTHRHQDAAMGLVGASEQEGLKQRLAIACIFAKYIESVAPFVFVREHFLADNNEADLDLFRV